MSQHARRMTNQRDWLTGSNRAFDQVDGVAVFGQIPHRAVAAGIKDGVELIAGNVLEFCSAVKRRHRIGVRFKATGLVRLKVGLVALWVEWWFAASRRAQSEFHAGVLEHIVRCSKFLEPKARLASCVTQLIVRSQDYENLH